MPLSILVPLVVGGIMCIVLVVHLMGWTAKAELDEARVRSVWLHEHPDASIEHVDLSDDKRVALVALAGAQAVCVWSFGADTVARPLDVGFARITETSCGFNIRFNDPGAPKLEVALAGAEARAAWLTAVGDRGAG